jgi:WD40 repeat protein
MEGKNQPINEIPQETSASSCKQATKQQTLDGDFPPADSNPENSSNMDTSHDDQLYPSTATHTPLPTADDIATALQSLPGLFFHRIASRVLEVGIDGNQLLGLVYSVNPGESLAHMNTKDVKRYSDEVKGITSPLGETEQSLDEEGGEDVNFDPASQVVPSKRRLIRIRKEPSDPSTAASTLPTPDELAAVLRSGPGEFYQQLASQIQDVDIDGKQLKEFVFSVLPHIPVNVILEHILPLLDRVSFNRLCSTYKEILNASRNVTPPWPHKSLETGSELCSLAFSPDSGSLACGCEDGIIRIWDRRYGRCTQLVGHTDYIRSLSFSPDGKILACGSHDTTIRLWRLADNSYTVLEGHTSYVMSVAFAPNGRKLASGSHDGFIRFWDVHDGSCTKMLRDDRFDCVWSVAFSPDGVTLASVGCLIIEEEEEDVEFEVGVILLWDISDEDDGSSLLFRSEERDSMILSIAYSPDGQYLATGSINSKVQLWNVASRSLQTVFEGHSNFIRSVCFSPNGKILASASDDRTVRLWDIEAKDSGCLANLSARHNELVMSVAFSPDGRTLASGSADQNGTVRLWNPFEEHKLDRTVDWGEILGLRNRSS